MWTSGTLNGYTYSVKFYDTGSRFGIGGDGRISKMSISKDGVELYSYERELGFDSLDEGGRAVYNELLKKYN